MSQELNLRLLLTEMNAMAEEVWAVLRETDAHLQPHLHSSLDAVYQGLCNACGATEDVLRRQMR